MLFQHGEVSLHFRFCECLKEFFFIDLNFVVKLVVRFTRQKVYVKMRLRCWIFFSEGCVGLTNFTSRGDLADDFFLKFCDGIHDFYAFLFGELIQFFDMTLWNDEDMPYDKIRIA